MSMKIAHFAWDRIEEANKLLEEVSVVQNGVYFRDTGAIILYTQKREGGVSKEEHVKNIKDEIARAEAEMMDAHISLEVSNIRFNHAKGKSGMKKIEESANQQASMSADTFEQKKAEAEAYRILLDRVEKGDFVVGEGMKWPENE